MSSNPQLTIPTPDPRLQYIGNLFSAENAQAHLHFPDEEM